jgi:hypothetical protein
LSLLLFALFLLFSSSSLEPPRYDSFRLSAGRDYSEPSALDHCLLDHQGPDATQHVEAAQAAQDFED